jgi:CheY-like chemotaxis protein
MTRTILLADDSLTIQKVVELTFADTQYNVVAQSSGEDLLQRLPEVRPDLVICDIIMPGKDGYEVCQEIKSDPNSLHIPVILLSGTFEPFDRDRALAAGCSEIITKPFEARKLVDCVERLLQRGTTEQATIEVEAVPKAVAPRVDAVSPQVTAEIDLSVETPVQPVTPPDESSGPIPSPPLAVVSPPEVGARLSDEVPGLEFTDTGFADMEAAALEPDDRDTDVPDDGLDFEFSDEHEAFGEPDAFIDPAPTYEAQIEEPTTEPELSVEAVTSAVEAQPVEVSGAIDVEPPSEPFPEPGDETAPPIADSSAPFAAPVAPPEIPTPTADEATIPSTTLPAETILPEIDPIPGVETDFEAEPEAEFTPEPEFAVEAEPVVTPEPDLSIALEPEPDPEPVPPPAAAQPLIEEETYAEPDRQSATSLSEADTGPVDPEAFKPVSAVEPEVSLEAIDENVIEPIPSTPATEEVGLSDDDIERIARRLLELAADRIESIAWEVVPDMAEIVVRKRIRELETEADQPTQEPLQ